MLRINILMLPLSFFFFHISTLCISLSFFFYQLVVFKALCFSAAAPSAPLQYQYSTSHVHAHK